MNKLLSNLIIIGIVLIGIVLIVIATRQVSSFPTSEVLIENSTFNYNFTDYDHGLLDEHNLNTPVGDTGRGQSFRIGISNANQSYYLTRLVLLAASGNGAHNGTTIIHIQEANATGYPFGSDIANSTFNNSNLRFGWNNISLTSYAPVQPGKDYFFFVNTSVQHWTTNFTTTNPYSGGKTLKWINAQWREDTSGIQGLNDLWFFVYGTPQFTFTNLTSTFVNKTAQNATACEWNVTC